MNTTESNTVIELEIEPSVAITNCAANELAVPADRAAALFAPFAKPFAAAAALIAEEPAATDANSARVLRLKIVKARTEIARTKDLAKADVKIVGNLIDWYHNRGRNECQAAEARLEEIEKAEERAEAERKSNIKRTRLAELLAVGVDGQFYPLGDLPAESYNQLLSSHRLAHEMRLAAEAKAKEDARINAEKVEADRIAREKAESAERERVRLENERLRKEAEAQKAALMIERAKAQAEADRVAAKTRAANLAREAEMKAEREKVEAVARVERERAAKERAELERKAQDERRHRERLEAEAKARIEAEEKRQREEQEMAARAAAAPDAEKIKAFAALVLTLEVPEMATPAGKRAAVRLVDMVMRLSLDVGSVGRGLSAEAGSAVKL